MIIAQHTLKTINAYNALFVGIAHPHRDVHRSCASIAHRHRCTLTRHLPCTDRQFVIDNDIRRVTVHRRVAVGPVPPRAASHCNRNRAKMSNSYAVYSIERLTVTQLVSVAVGVASGSVAVGLLVVA